MSDLGTLKSRIADDIARSDLTSQIATAINNAIRHYEREPFWFNEDTTTLPTVANTQNISLVTVADFVAARGLRVTVNTSTYDLIPRTKGYIDALTVTASHTGQPSDWTIYAQNLWLWPVPDAVYTLTMTYQKSLGALSSSSDTNAWMVEAEALIRNRAESEVYSSVIRDQEMAALTRGWEMDELRSLQSQTSRYTASGSIVPHSW